jgi:hypothetical protein
MNSRLRAMLAVLFSTSALACAQVPAPKSPSAPPAPPQNAADARKAIAQALKELGDSPTDAPTIQAGPAVAPAPPTAVTAGTSKAGATEDKDLRSGGGGSAEATSSSCPRRCEASHSLDRATQALCELVGEEDAECKEARAAALRGEQAVALCSCR